jgi:gliding motility-associated-like protein
MDGVCDTFALLPPALLTGLATWSSNGNGLETITNYGFAYFNPALAGTGTWDVTYCWDDQVGCNSCMTHQLIVTCNQPVISVTPINATCENFPDGSITLTTSGGQSPYTYFLDGSPQAGGANHVFANVGTGNYSVWVTDQTGCTSDTVAVTVGVNTNFFNAITSIPDTCGRGVGTVIVAASGGQFPHEYQLGSQPINSTGLFANVAAGTYALVTMDAVGCTQHEFVDVMSYDLNCQVGSLVTNAFSPDGDGVNDVWIIPELLTYPNNNVLIVDRWGGVVRRFENYDNFSVVWDGRGAHGKPMPVGTYFYSIQIAEANRSIAGWVQLIR